MSDVVGQLAEGEPFAIGWFYKAANDTFVYSLRSREGGVDVSKVAEEFGGGGHARAAGFSLDYLLRPYVETTKVEEPF